MIDAERIFKPIHTENPNKVVFAHLHINSIRNRWTLLVDQIKGNVDVLKISETKIDDSFPFNRLFQFII